MRARTISRSCMRCTSQARTLARACWNTNRTKAAWCWRGKSNSPSAGKFGFSRPATRFSSTAASRIDSATLGVVRPPWSRHARRRISSSECPQAHALLNIHELSMSKQQDQASSALNRLDLYDVHGQLSDEERLVQVSVARFVDEQVLPHIAECFDQQRFPSELIPQLAELGLLGSSLEGHGCAGLNAMCYGLICQELERGDSGLRSFVSVQSSLCMYPLSVFGSEDQKQNYLPKMARGELIGCFGLTEAHGGSDPANMKTWARRKGGDWIVNGSKMWI